MAVVLPMLQSSLLAPDIIETIPLQVGKPIFSELMQSRHAATLSCLLISASSCDLTGSFTCDIAACALASRCCRICTSFANRSIPASVVHGCASYHLPSSWPMVRLTAAVSPYG